MLSLATDVFRAVVDHAQRGYPNEACGLLLGDASGETRRVVEARETSNVERERAADRYEIDPLDYLAAEERARSLGLAVVGVYHSHPDHPSRPSNTDRERAADVWGNAKSWSYLILEVVSGKVTSARSWVLEEGAFREEELGVRDSETARESRGPDSRRPKAAIPETAHDRDGEDPHPAASSREGE